MSADKPTQHASQGALGTADPSSDDLVTDALSHRKHGDEVPSVDDLIAEYDEEKPQRQLSPRLDAVITFITFCVSIFVLWQVFFPQSKGNQYYLILFLACVLPLVFVLYRFGRRRTKRSEPEPTKTDDGLPAGATAVDRDGNAIAEAPRARGWRNGSDNPGIIDWALAAITLLVCIYPVLPMVIGDGGGGFDEFLNRQGTLGTVDVVMGFALTILILEATRRTSGMIMPIVCIVFILYAYYGGLLPQTWAVSHSGQKVMKPPYSSIVATTTISTLVRGSRRARPQQIRHASGPATNTVSSSRLMTDCDGRCQVSYMEKPGERGRERIWKHTRSAPAQRLSALA